MIQGKKTLIIITLIIISLFVRELPYVNVLFANRIWIFYVFLFIFLYPIRKKEHLFTIAASFLLFALVFTLLDLDPFAEVLGDLIYGLLWIVLFLHIRSLIRLKE